MTYLLDVNALLAAIIANHPQHAAATSWLKNKSVATCPLSELGFLRIATNSKAYGFTMPFARNALEAFLTANKAQFVPADIPALKSTASRSEEVTDFYLADVAAGKKMKLASFDRSIAHASAEVIV